MASVIGRQFTFSRREILGRCGQVRPQLLTLQNIAIDNLPHGDNLEIVQLLAL